MIRQIAGFGSKLISALALGAVLTVPMVTASAHEPSLDQAAGSASPTSRILGVQQAFGSMSIASRLSAPSELLYHGGLVEHTNKAYAIYWVPPGYTVSTNDETQYGDKTVSVQYKSTFGGSTVDANALPTSGCSDAPFTRVCLTDAETQTEVQKVVSSRHWTANSTTEFFMFTAKGIGSCFDGSSSACSFSTYCAYHSWIGGGTTATLYSNMPHAATANCDAGQRPSHDDADVTINVTSHEHNEMITDEQGNAWWDTSGREIGDKCAWVFGSLVGPTGSKYNQVINGYNYFLQEECSNATSKCVLQGK